MHWPHFKFSKAVCGHHIGKHLFEMVCPASSECWMILGGQAPSMKSNHFWIVNLQIIFIFLVMCLAVFKILMITSPSYSQKKVLFQKIRTHSSFSLHSELNAKSKELHLQISEDGQSSEGGWRAGGWRPCPLEGSSSALTRAEGSWGGRETRRRPAPPHTIWVSPGNVWL